MKSLRIIITMIPAFLFGAEYDALMNSYCMVETIDRQKSKISDLQDEVTKLDRSAEIGEKKIQILLDIEKFIENHPESQNNPEFMDEVKASIFKRHRTAEINLAIAKMEKDVLSEEAQKESETLIQTKQLLIERMDSVILRLQEIDNLEEAILVQLHALRAEKEALLEQSEHHRKIRKKLGINNVDEILKRQK